jgi:hypothetical protein
MLADLRARAPDGTGAQDTAESRGDSGEQPVQSRRSA